LESNLEKKQQMFATGRQIKKVREEKGLSQIDLARDAGISQAQLSMLETGRNALHLEMAIKLADTMGCTVDHLLGRLNKPESKGERLMAVFNRATPLQQDTLISVAELFVHRPFETPAGEA
jgi:transcriptional regulator with XRE-family HTH domain